MPDNDHAAKTGSNPQKMADRRTIRYLWIGLVTYFLILLNLIRIARTIPYQMLILGALLNAVILATIILTMRRIYERMRNQKD
ncbi:MAG: hypothetical protein ABR973_12755 [Candidatus Acidiferrales bacterium]|jgi:hypothetical protein